MSLIDDPKFWFGFLALEVGFPLLIPSKRWAGGLMVLAGLLFLGAAFGIRVGTSFLQAHLSVIAYLGTAFLLIGLIAVLVRFTGRQRQESAEAAISAIPEPPIPQITPAPPLSYTAPPKPKATVAEHNANVRRLINDDNAPSPGDLRVVFNLNIESGLVTLNFQSDRSSRHEDALFLLLYGYKFLAGIDDVEVSKLINRWQLRPAPHGWTPIGLQIRGWGRV
jgi:hypothetical protein